MNRDELLTAIHDRRAELERLWDGVSEDLLTQYPGPQPDWSVKDLIAHLTFWQQMTVDCLRAGLRGETPDWDVDIDAENARLLAQNARRSLADVRADFDASLEAVTHLLKDLNDSDFASPERFPWLHGASASETLADNTCDHYAEHLPDLQAWRGRLS